MKNLTFVMIILVTFFNCSEDGVSPIQEEHLVAHWSLNETAGMVISDSSPQNNDGTNYGAMSTQGVIAGALDFNGVDQSIHIPGKNDLPPEGIRNLEYGTIMVWFNYREYTDEIVPILYFGESDSASDHNSLILEIGHGRMGYHKRLFFTIVNARFCFDTNADIEPNQWYHFAAVVSSSGNTGYLNGVELTDRRYNLGSDETYTDFFASVPVQEMLAIGYGRYGLMDKFAWFNGLIDDVRIYDTALTPEEIQSIYQRGISELEISGMPAISQKYGS